MPGIWLIEEVNGGVRVALASAAHVAHLPLPVFMHLLSSSRAKRSAPTNTSSPLTLAPTLTQPLGFLDTFLAWIADWEEADLRHMEDDHLDGTALLQSWSLLMTRMVSSRCRGCL